jgi:hypothetical protein
MCFSSGTVTPTGMSRRGKGGGSIKTFNSSMTQCAVGFWLVLGLAQRVAKREMDMVPLLYCTVIEKFR